MHHWNTSVELVVGFFFPVYLVLRLCVHFKQREGEILHGCGKHLGKKMKANAQELESKSIY